MTEFKFKDDKELKEFMKFFKKELPNPEHHPIKAMWLRDWWFTMVKKGDNAIVKGKE